MQRLVCAALFSCLAVMLAPSPAARAEVAEVRITRHPDVKTLADFTEKDRIAVPTIKISTQAVLLQIAAKRQLGEAARNQLDAITVQLGHPDAVAAVTSQNHEINSHFSLPPYQ